MYTKMVSINKGGRVEHTLTWTVEDTKTRSISVAELGVTRVGSDTTCVRLNDDTTEIYKFVIKRGSYI